MWRYPLPSVSHRPGLHYNSLCTTKMYLCPPLLSFSPTVLCTKRSFGSTMASTTVDWSKETVSLHRWRKPRIMGSGVTQRIRTICKVRNNCSGPISALQPWLVLGKWHYMSLTGKVTEYRWIRQQSVTAALFLRTSHSKFIAQLSPPVYGVLKSDTLLLNQAKCGRNTIMHEDVWDFSVT